MPVKQIFKLNEATTGLSDKSILHHHRLISAILGKAKKERVIPFNVAIEHTNSPKLTKKEAIYLDDIQAQRVVELLLNEDGYTGENVHIDIVIQRCPTRGAVRFGMAGY